MITYKTYLAAVGRPPLPPAQELRTVKADGHREMLPAGKIAVWANGERRIEEKAA